MLDAGQPTGQLYGDAWVRAWWPVLALLLGVLVIVVGGILFSS